MGSQGQTPPTTFIANNPTKPSNLEMIVMSPNISNPHCKKVPNSRLEVYYDSQMQTIWLEYGHPPDEEECAVCEKEDPK